MGIVDIGALDVVVNVFVNVDADADADGFRLHSSGRLRASSASGFTTATASTLSVVSERLSERF
jgi:hypothetical protein